MPYYFFGWNIFLLVKIALLSLVIITVILYLTRLDKSHTLD